jgi:excisionase family DNA binding protein
MYLTVKELAERLKVKPVTIYKWCREGYFDIAKINLSGTIRFEENKLEDCFDKLRAR